MIAKGTRHNNGAKLARYMITGKEGERAELWELRGFETPDIQDAFRNVHIMADAIGSEKPFFHVQVRHPEGEKRTRDQWRYEADRIEAKLGLSAQPRAVASHTDKATGEEHMHLAWSLIDEQSMRLKPLPFFKLRLKDICRELEKELDLTPVSNQREGEVKFAPTRAEDEQARRLDVDIHAIRNTMRNCYTRSDCGHSFDTELAHEGLILAKGNRRDYVVIDHAGGLHALGKRILGATASQVREKLADLDRHQIPTIEQARQLMLDLPRDRMDRLTRELSDVQKQIEAEREYAKRDPVREELAWQDALAKAAIEKEKVERRFVETMPEQQTHVRGGREKEQKAPEKLKGAARHIWTAIHHSDNAKAFSAALDEQGIALAAVRNEEAQRSHMKASFAKEVGNFSPEYRPGEIVAVTMQGQIYQLNRRNTGKEISEIEAFVAPLDHPQLPGIEATKQSQQQRMSEKHCPVKPPQPAPLKTSPAFHFEGATRAAAQPEPAPSLPANLKGPAAQIWTAYNIRTHMQERERKDLLGNIEQYQVPISVKGGRDPYQFGSALEDKGMALARVTKDEAERSEKEAAHWKTHREWRPTYREGEFVAITQRGGVYSLNKWTTGHDAKEVQAFLGKANWKGLSGIDSTKAIMESRREQRNLDRQATGDDIAASRLKRATNISDKAPVYRGKASNTPAAISKTADRTLGSALSLGEKLFEGLFSLLDPPATPAQREQTAEKARDEREVQAERQIDFSNYTADAAQGRQNHQEQQAARDRQREIERTDNCLGDTNRSPGRNHHRQRRERARPRQSPCKRPCPSPAIFARRYQAAIPSGVRLSHPPCACAAADKAPQG